MPGIRACKHGSDDCFPTVLGRQLTFNGTKTPLLFLESSLLVTIRELSIHGNIKKFWMPFPTPTRYGLERRCWGLKTSLSAVVEIPNPYLTVRLQSRWNFVNSLHIIKASDIRIVFIFFSYLRCTGHENFKWQQNPLVMLLQRRTDSGTVWISESRSDLVPFVVLCYFMKSVMILDNLFQSIITIYQSEELFNNYIDPDYVIFIE